MPTVSIASCPQCGRPHANLYAYRGHQGGGNYTFCPKTDKPFACDATPTTGATNMSQHTPGPWQVINGGGRMERYAVENANGYRVCNVPDISLAPQNAANARLIAAAPDLLWVVRCIFQDLPEHRDWLDPAVEGTARMVLKELGVA